MVLDLPLYPFFFNSRYPNLTRWSIISLKCCLSVQSYIDYRRARFCSIFLNPRKLEHSYRPQTLMQKLEQTFYSICGKWEKTVCCTISLAHSRHSPCLLKPSCIYFIHVFSGAACWTFHSLGLILRSNLLGFRWASVRLTCSNYFSLFGFRFPQWAGCSRTCGYCRF